MAPRAGEQLCADRVEVIEIFAHDGQQRCDAFARDADFHHVGLDAEALQLRRTIPVEAAGHRGGVDMKGSSRPMD